MIKDLNTVTIFSSKTSQPNSFFYECTCRICESRKQLYAYQNASHEELVNRVEHALLSTPLIYKNINLNVSSHQFLQNINPQTYLQLISKLAPAQKQLQAYLRLSLSNINKFNRRYRHEIICKLNDHNLHFLEQLIPVINSDIYEDTDLFIHEKILKYIYHQEIILKELQHADILTDMIFSEWYERLFKAIFQIRRSSSDIIRQHYSHATAYPDTTQFQDSSTANIIS
ncbi:MAG: hypothetical protein KatS3mg087_0655 [Patescibacteria group bacterium]|nr:MAG: hypothetical protein KatS3mg087_0655 [Patescibacteria group bacterium]